MSRFIPFTDEELYQAHHSSIKDYLESVGEKVLRSGTEYMWEKHDSVKIRGHVWYRHSTGDKGTAVNFLMEFFKFSFQDAVITLLNGNYIASSQSRPEDIAKMDLPVIRHKKSNIILPQRNSDNKRLYAYLCSTRCISYQIVEYFVRRNLIYEDKDNHNIVFIAKNKMGTVKYAGLKGTMNNIPFGIELNNCDKKYSFKHVGTSDTLYVFEAFIDMFSYIDLFLINKNWKSENYIALGGLKYQPLRQLVDDYPHIKNIVIATDNDLHSSDGINHGQVFANKVKKLLSDIFNVIIDIPELKDWNEILKIQRREK